MTICHNVFCFPSRSAESTAPRAPATRRSPVTKNSRARIAITSHPGISRWSRSVTNAAAISTLSASGSINWPKAVTKFRSRAIFPSSQSVIDAMENKTSPTVNP